jgi:predicted alpha/beta hydrolase family esterase
MKRAIIIHGWDQKPDQEWLPWLGKQLQEKGWKVDLPEMPNTKNPNLTEWTETLKKLKPDKDTLLIGHSLANALIMKYLEEVANPVRGTVMVAAWDWLLEDVKEYHQTFFENGFDYEKIKARKLPLTMVQSTNDPYIDFERSKKLAEKIGAELVTVQNAGHFMARNGYSEFPKLLEIIENITENI